MGGRGGGSGSREARRGGEWVGGSGEGACCRRSSARASRLNVFPNADTDKSGALSFEEFQAYVEGKDKALRRCLPPARLRFPHSPHRIHPPRS